MKAVLTEPKFSVGQKVVFINDYGVNWGEKIITEIQWNEVRGNTYQYVGMDPPWFFASERNLFDPLDTEGIAKATVVVA